MIELNIVNGCQRDGPCRQGNLDARGLKLHTEIQQAAKERIDLREDPSAVMDLVMEKVTENKPNFQCVHCGSDVQIIMDSKGYMSLMDTVGDAMSEDGGSSPQGQERGSSQIQPPAAGSSREPAGENLEYNPAPIGGNEPLPGEAPPQEDPGAGISPPSSGPDSVPSPPDPPEEQGGQSADAGPDSGEGEEELPPHLRNFHIE
jgi:hypothetical protein